MFLSCVSNNVVDQLFAALLVSLILWFLYQNQAGFCGCTDWFDSYQIVNAG